MKATILLNELSRIASLTSSNRVVPITSCVKLEFSHDTVKASVTDMRSYISVDIPIHSDLTDSICVDCAQFLAILKGFGDSDIALSIDENTLTIKSGKSKYKLPILPASDFPVQQQYSGEYTKLQSETLTTAIKATAFACSTDELRPAMGGVFFDGQYAVATDAHKLVKFDMGSDSKIDGIIPKQSAELLNRLALGELQIAKQNGILFAKWGGYSFTTRLVDERYPDYTAVIPSSHEAQAIFEISHLIDVVSRLLLTSNKQSSLVRLSLGQESTATSADIDLATEGVEQLECQYTGESMEIGVNGKFLLEALRTIPDSVVKINLIAPNRAMTIITPDRTVLIMPVNIN